MKNMINSEKVFSIMLFFVHIRRLLCDPELIQEMFHYLPPYPN